MIAETNTNYPAGLNLTDNNDLSHTSRSSSQVLVHASRMSREIVHVKLPLSMLKEKTVTPEQNRDFLKRFEEHKMYCIECQGKKLIETALSHPQSARLEEHPFPQDNLRSSRT